MIYILLYIIWYFNLFCPVGTSVTLDGTAYIRYTLNRTFDELFESIAISVRTETEDGIILYTHGKDRFTLEVNRIHFSCICGDQKYS